MLVLTYDYQDDDNDPESGSIITWYKDTIEQASLSGQSSISSTLTTRGEEWYAEVTPSDGKDEEIPSYQIQYQSLIHRQRHPT